MKTNKYDFRRKLKFETKITLLYLIFGFLWILFSDKVLDMLVTDDSLLTQFQSYKGSFYVLVTSGFLYLLIKKHMHDLRNTEAQLNDSEFRFKKLYDNGPFGMVMVNKELRFIKANSEFCKIIGYSESEIQHLTSKDISHPDDFKKDMPFIQKLIKKEIAVYKTEKRYIRKDGVMIWGSLAVTANFDKEGKFLYNLGIVEDITQRKQVEELLIESQSKFKNLIWDMHVGVLIQGHDSEILLSNPMALELLGVSESQLLGKTSFDPDWNVIHEDGSPFPGSTHPVPQAIATKHSVRGVVMGVFHPLNGERVWLLVDAIPQLNPNGTVQQVVCTFIDISKRKEAEQELKDSREQLRNFASHLQKVREKERLSITIEIHDSLAQFLVALKIDMGMYKNKLLKGNKVVEVENVISELDSFILKTENTITTARRIMNGLRPEQLELLGFIDATEVFLNDFEEAHHIKCWFETTLSELNIKSELEFTLFRILQESFSNILKHAFATMVTVLLTNNDGLLVLEIVDNGIGFDKNNSGRKDSYGLISIKEQLKLINGHFDISSTVGEGTKLRIEIPV
ncbi:MAG: PAS domain-containing sensor histidine kinase [Paludibacter sp.]